MYKTRIAQVMLKWNNIAHSKIIVQKLNSSMKHNITMKPVQEKFANSEQRVEYFITLQAVRVNLQEKHCSERLDWCYRIYAIGCKLSYNTFYS